MKQVSFDSPPLAAAQLASKAKHDNHDQGTSNMTETDTEYYDKTEEEVDSLPSEEGQIRWNHRPPCSVAPNCVQVLPARLAAFLQRKGDGGEAGVRGAPPDRDTGGEQSQTLA